MKRSVASLHSIGGRRSPALRVPEAGMALNRSFLNQSASLSRFVRCSLHTATRDALSPLDTEEVLSQGRAAVLEHWPAANHAVNFLVTCVPDVQESNGDLLSIFRQRRTFPTSCLQIQYHGEGTHLGVKGQWTLTFRPDGAFHEEFKSPMLSSFSGYDGGRDSRSWVVWS